jgi:hypothetical protein
VIYYRTLFSAQCKKDGLTGRNHIHPILFTLIRDEPIKAPADGPFVMEDFDDVWPGYEEPVIFYH